MSLSTIADLVRANEGPYRRRSRASYCVVPSLFVVYRFWRRVSVFKSPNCVSGCPLSDRRQIIPSCFLSGKDFRNLTVRVRTKCGEIIGMCDVRREVLGTRYTAGYSNTAAPAIHQATTMYRCNRHVLHVCRWVAFTKRLRVKICVESATRSLFCAVRCTELCTWTTSLAWYTKHGEGSTPQPAPYWYILTMRGRVFFQK